MRASYSPYVTTSPLVAMMKHGSSACVVAYFPGYMHRSMLARRLTLPSMRVSVEIRAITPDEAVALPAGHPRRVPRRRHGRRRGVVARERRRRSTGRCAAFDGPDIVATFGVVPDRADAARRGDRARPARVTAVTCRATHRRQGILTRMMDATWRRAATGARSPTS